MSYIHILSFAVLISGAVSLALPVFASEENPEILEDALEEEAEEELPTDGGATSGIAESAKFHSKEAVKGFLDDLVENPSN